MDPLRIQLFGSLQLTRRGELLPRTTSQKAASLIAYLACYAQKEHPRDLLMEILWPEADPDAARVRFRTVLSDVREALNCNAAPEECPLHTTRSSVRWKPGVVTTDLAEFEELLKQAGTCSDPRARAALLESALELSREELLPGFYDEWVLRERDRAGALRREALRRLAAAREAQGDAAGAAAPLRELVLDDPLNEEAHSELIRLFVASGRPAAAIRQYEELSEILRRELDVEPSLEAQALAMAARRSESITVQPAQVAPIRRATPAAESGLDPAPSAAVPRKRPGFAVRLGAAGILSAVVIGGLLLIPSRSRNYTPLPNFPTAGKVVWRTWYPYAVDEQNGEVTAGCAFPGGSEQSYFFTGFVRTNQHDVDYLTMKLDKDGRLVWRARYNGTGNDVDRARDTVADEEGNVYVTGDSDNGRGNGKTRLAGLDIVTVSYDANGRERWKARYNGPEDGEEYAIQMKRDYVGGLYVFGCRQAPGEGSLVLLKYRESDGGLLWQRRLDGVWPGQNHEVRAGLALAGKGPVVVGSVPGRGPTGREADWLVAQLDPRDGSVRWSRRYGTRNGMEDGVRDVTVSVTGIIVAGHTLGLPGSPFAGRRDSVLACYNEDGELQWLRGAKSDADYLAHIRRVTAAGDRLYLLGAAVGEAGVAQFRMVARDVYGHLLWAQTTGFPSVTPASGPAVMAAIGNGNAFLACGDYKYPSIADNADQVSARFDAKGRPVWRDTFDAAGLTELPADVTLWAHNWDPVVAGRSFRVKDKPEIVFTRYRW